ncbi:7153_t:CDS:1, partial [Dentiscutata heterogama]
MKGEILLQYIQNKVTDFVNSGLFKHYSSAAAFQDEIKKLKPENKKLAKALESSNNKLRSSCMKIVRAEKTKNKNISKIQSITQKSKK